VRFAHKFNARSLERAPDFLDRIEVGFNPAFKPLKPANCHDCHTRLESKPILPPAEKRSRCLDLPHVNEHPDPPTSLPPKKKSSITGSPRCIPQISACRRFEIFLVRPSGRYSVLQNKMCRFSLRLDTLASMGNPDHILVVDDDLGLRELLDRYFAGNGYRVTSVANGRQMREVLANHRVDLIVLDLMLPGDDGLTLCRNLRANQPYDIPILMLTARGDEADRIVGLEMGADDYLTKPFAPRELLARIRSVLRRAKMLPRNLAASEKARLLRFGEWKLDTAGRFLIDSGETVVSLSGAEYRLLRVFLDRPQHVLNRDQLLDLTQGRESEAFDRSIDLLVSRLRQRLRDDAREPSYIKTVRSEGYVFAASVEALRKPS
jgi:two-component system, OmpR family, response regulator